MSDNYTCSLCGTGNMDADAALAHDCDREPVVAMAPEPTGMDVLVEMQAKQIEVLERIADALEYRNMKEYGA